MTDEQLHHDNSFFIKNKFPIILVCDGVNSPANIGSLFRVADSFGIEHIYFCGKEITVISKRMMRTARATHQMVPHTTHEKISTIIEDLILKKYKIIALEITKNSIPITECYFSPTEKIALIIGDENRGISPEVLATIDKSVYINMYGTNSSMNVATAAGITLYEITKQLKPRN